MKKKYLIFGKDGWLAGLFKERLGDEAEMSLVDITDVKALERELEEKKPEVIINAAGQTGRPNIDWCESHNEETLASNFYGPKNIVTAIQTVLAPDEWPLLVHLGSGCIFQGDGPEHDGWSESDIPTPESFYSKTKWMADQHLLSVYRNRVLILRLRMPIDSSLSPRNLIMKLIGYDKIINDKNSMTIIPDFMDTAIKLIDSKSTGVYHVTNPGLISPADIMRRYQAIVDPAFKFEEVACSDLDIAAPRSNCVLKTNGLKEAGIELEPIGKRVDEILEEFKANMIKFNEES